MYTAAHSQAGARGGITPMQRESDPARRRRWALRAAQRTAARHGLGVPEPRLLDDCNNTVVHLAPWPLVAKVSDTSRRPTAQARLQRELEIGLHLARADVPIAAPSTELPARVHRYRRHVLTFWQFQRADPTAVVDGMAAARTLLEVHRGLDTFTGKLPFFLDRQVARAGALLAGSSSRLAMAPWDHVFLAAEHARLTSEVRARRTCGRPLHGDPHRENLLIAGERCLLLDFESCCIGPLEWDLSALPGGGADLWRSADRELLGVLQRLRSLCVVVWCRTQMAGPPKLALAAQLHLRFLREQAGQPAA